MPLHLEHSLQVEPALARPLSSLQEPHCLLVLCLQAGRKLRAQLMGQLADRVSGDACKAEGSSRGPEQARRDCAQCGGLRVAALLAPAQGPDCKLNHAAMHLVTTHLMLL